MDNEPITILPYSNFLDIRNRESGYIEDNVMNIRRIRNFKVSYSGKNARAYFIDTFCESYEIVFGSLVAEYSNATVNYLNEKYGRFFEVCNEIATHSDADSHCWDDDGDEYGTYSSSVHIMVVHNYAFKLKEGVQLNALKLKFPEIANTGMFFKPYDECKSEVNEWFIEDIVKPIKNTFNEEELINAYKKKIDFITD